MPTYATTEEYCKTLEAIQAGFALDVQRLASRFRALRRLAGLLQIAGASIALPNPTALIAVDNFDITKYQELYALCPGLLPPYTGQSLAALKGTLEDAYLALLNRSLTHPWAKLATLQDVFDKELSDLVDKVASVIGPGIAITECLTLLCQNVAGNVLFTPDELAQAPGQFNQMVTDASAETATT
jgi:hypothetical protein